MFARRTVVEVVTILFAITACVALLLTGAGLVVLAALGHLPPGSLSPTVDFLQTTTGLIIGALLGLLTKQTSPARTNLDPPLTTRPRGGAMTESIPDPREPQDPVERPDLEPPDEPDRSGQQDEPGGGERPDGEQK